MQNVAHPAAPSAWRPSGGGGRIFVPLLGGGWDGWLQDNNMLGALLFNRTNTQAALRVRPALISLLALASALFCSVAAAATSDWFLGGSYDGYDLDVGQAPFGWLAVDNAQGATNVKDTSAWLNGTLVGTSNGVAAVVLVYWGAANGGTNRDAWSHTNDFGSVAEGAVLTTNINVSANTLYYYRFYATNAAGEAWAMESAYFIAPGVPVLICEPSVVGITKATLQGNLTAGVSAAIEVFWGQDTNAWANTNILGTLRQGAFDTPANELSPGTVYYYRCYGTNDYGEGWSEIAAFTTGVEVTGSFVGGSYDGYDLDVGLSSLGWLSVDNAQGATNVTDTSAWLNGTLVGTSNGVAAVVLVYWGAANGGTNRDAWSHTNDFGSVAEGAVLTTNINVSANTLYYYRFYATNAAGEAWAMESAYFIAPGVPVLICEPSVVGITKATLQGNLTAGVSAAIEVFWGQDTNAWANTNILGTLRQGAFDTPANELSPGTVYYYRCYGTNDYGEGWSAIAAFTTGVEVTGSFVGGSYDGYDRFDGQPRMDSYKGTVFSIR